jgi:hypothetical protein
MSHAEDNFSNIVHKQTNKRRHTTNFRLVGVIAQGSLARWLTLWLPSVLGSEL